MIEFYYYMSISKRYFLLLTLLIPLSTYAYTFNTNIKYGDRSNDVFFLQKFLNSSADTQITLVGPGSPGQESTYFGALTLTAVKKFQLKYFGDILVPAGLNAPNGFVGALTRAKLNSLNTLSGNSPTTGANETPNTTITSSGQATLSTSQPVITAITPSSFSEGDMVTIQGSGFGSSDVISFIFADQQTVAASSTDGKTITFRAVTPIGESVQAQLKSVAAKSSAVLKIVQDAFKDRFNSKGKDGAYVQTYITVKNGAFLSNPYPVTLKLFTDQ